MSAEHLSGIAPLMERYDVFVVDLWGTLHDGIKPYPGAIGAMKRLKKAGKRVALLSNAPRRAVLAEKTLVEMGFGDLYALLLTSGESVHASLRDRPDEWHRQLSGKCWHLGPPRDRSIFEGLDILVTGTPEGAGFCVATGIDLNEETLEDYRPMLDRARELELPMVCANPDIKVPVGDQIVLCAGAFAEYYREIGGDVFWHGKPYPAIYEELFADIEALGGGSVDRKRTIAIGDGLSTDIWGARRAGIASALVLCGVHRPRVKTNWLGRPEQESLDVLFATAPVPPDFTLPSLKW